MYMEDSTIYHFLFTSEFKFLNHLAVVYENFYQKFQSCRS